jgi:RNA polymerase sigma-70 factor (ECF subfamily)
MNKKTMQNSSDIELINLATRGNEKAFQFLVERHCGMVFKVAFKWCGEKEDAEDISQDVFIKLAEKIHRFKPDTAAFTTWLYKVTINAAKDFQRKKRVRRNKETTFAETGIVADTLKAPEEKLAQEQALQILDRLPIKEKEAVLLTVSEGMSHKKVAKILGCAETTVSWRVHNARKKLNKWRGR